MFLQAFAFPKLELAYKYNGFVDFLKNTHNKMNLFTNPFKGVFETGHIDIYYIQIVIDIILPSRQRQDDIISAVQETG